MSHFAEISGSGSGSITYTVTRVLVAEQDFINSGAVGASSNWVQTSYNGSIRKNYAGIGHTYDESRDAFISPQPQNFVSSSLTFYEDDDPLPSYIRNYFTQNPSGSIPYILNEDSCLWELSGSGS